MRYTAVSTLCLVLWHGLAAVAGGQTALEANSRDAMVVLSGWAYRWGDSPVDEQGNLVWVSDRTIAGWQPTSTFLTPPGVPQDFLWLRTRLPEVLPDHPVLATRYLWMSAEVYLDSMLIYRTGTLHPDPENKYGAQKAHLFTLPSDAAGRMLSIRLYSNYGNLIGIPDAVYLSSEAGALRFAFREELSLLLIGLIMTIVGFLSLILLIRARARQRVLLLFYLGLFALCFGINYVCSPYIVQFVFARPVLLYYLVGLFPLFPVGLLGFFEQMIGAGYKRVIRRLWQVHLVFWVIVVMLDVLNVIPFFRVAPLFFGLLAISLLVMTITVLPAIRKGNQEARIFGVGMLVAILFGMFDTVFQGLLNRTDVPSLAPWGVLGLMVFLGYLLERRFTENTRNLQAAHARLELYSATLEKRVEERTHALRHKNEELAHTLQELKTTQNQLVQSEKLASLGQLTAGIAHEIKNPLNFVNNFSQLSIELANELEQELDARHEQPVANIMDEVRDLLVDLKSNAAKILEHGRRADGIVKSMLLHSRAKPGEVQSVNLNALLDEYVNLAYHGMRAQEADFNVTIERDYDPAVEVVNLVPQEMGRVFLNLLNNAFYAVHEKAKSGNEAYSPTVSVRTHQGGDHVAIQIYDNGAGIPEAYRERIFEPFFTTKPTGSGTGLGLSLSYDIVTRGHGGTLSVESEEGEGTRFVVTLPG